MNYGTFLRLLPYCSMISSILLHDYLSVLGMLPRLLPGCSIIVAIEYLLSHCSMTTLYWASCIGCFSISFATFDEDGIKTFFPNPLFLHAFLVA